MYEISLSKPPGIIDYPVIRNIVNESPNQVHNSIIQILCKVNTALSLINNVITLNLVNFNCKYNLKQIKSFSNHFFYSKKTIKEKKKTPHLTQKRKVAYFRNPRGGSLKSHSGQYQFVQIKKARSCSSIPTDGKNLTQLRGELGLKFPKKNESSARTSTIINEDRLAAKLPPPDFSAARYGASTRRRRSANWDNGYEKISCTRPLTGIPARPTHLARQSERERETKAAPTQLDKSSMPCLLSP